MRALSIAALALIGALSPRVTHAEDYEEPAFQVVHQAADFEVRRYEPIIVAEATVKGDRRRAAGEGFRLLAGYIFGNNSAKKSMNMTTPVTTRSIKMNMTIPVTTERTSDGGYVMHFMMERQYTMETLPVPNDKRVKLKTIPARTVAVRRYSGRTTDENFVDHKQKLLASLKKAGIRTLGEPLSAVYDGPYTLPWKRRNEVLVDVSYP